MLQLRRQILTSLNYHKLSFYSEDGSTLLYTQIVEKGKNGANPVVSGNISMPTKASTTQYDYYFSGWSLNANGSTSALALLNITENRKIYAAFGAIRKYTVNFYNGSTLLQSVIVVSGKNAAYTGSTPTRTQTAQYTFAFSGWSTTNSDTATAINGILNNITSDMNLYATYNSTLRSYTVTFYNGSTVLTTQSVKYGSNATYSGSTPTKSSSVANLSYTFSGWSTTNGGAASSTALTNITGARSVYAAFTSAYEKPLVLISGQTFSKPMSHVLTPSASSCSCSFSQANGSVNTVVYDDSTSDWAGVSIFTTNKYELSPYTSLKVTYDYANNTYGGSRLLLAYGSTTPSSSSFHPPYVDNKVDTRRSAAATNQTFTIDVSSRTGQYYIMLINDTVQAGTKQGGKYMIKKLWLE